MIGKSISHYRIIEKLGAGGMGEVFLAEDSHLNRRVAIKVLPDEFARDPERLARFDREAKLLASLSHPNIAAIYGLEKADGNLFLIMELVEGETLAQRNAKGPLAVDETLEVCRQIAEGMEYAHEKGIIHRDLKPANIKITPEGKVKVLDFGLAKVFSEEAVAADASHSPTLTDQMTRPGVILGTAAYMSPEQAKGKTVDRRADIWAFGCIMYESLTGSGPFHGDTVTETLAAVIKTEPDWHSLPADTPTNVRIMIQRCLQKDQCRRLRDIGDARIEIEDARIIPPTTAPGSVTGARRIFGWSVLALILIVAAFLAGTWLRAPADSPVTVWQGERLGGSTIAMWPRVSPNGQMVAFQALVEGQTQLGLMTPQSGDWQLPIRRKAPGYVGDISWSSDGARIYFERSRRIFSVPFLGGEEQPVLENAQSPQVLPDGSLLVTRINKERHQQLHRFVQETNSLLPLGAILKTPMVLPALRIFRDGREAVFLGRSIDATDTTDHLCGIDLTSGTLRRLAPKAPISQIEDWAYPLAMSADDQWVLLSLTSGNLWRIVAAPRDGSDRLREIITLTARPLAIDIGKDDSLYVDQIEQPFEIIRSSGSSGSLDQMRVGSEFLPLVLPLPDGRMLLQARTAGRDRLMRMEQGKDPVPFIAGTQEETRAPFALVGSDMFAFLIGPPLASKVALASTFDGHIIRRLNGVGAGAIKAFAGSPDGKKIYYVQDGTIWAIPAGDGQPSRICTGDAMATDPNGEYLIVQRSETDGVRLIRVPETGGQEQPVPLKSDLQLGGHLAPNAVAKDGRIVIQMESKDSWYLQAAVLDPRTGLVERVLPSHNADLQSMGWDKDGRLVAGAAFTNASLWRFRRSR